MYQRVNFWETGGENRGKASFRSGNDRSGRHAWDTREGVKSGQRKRRTLVGDLGKS